MKVALPMLSAVVLLAVTLSPGDLQALPGSEQGPGDGPQTCPLPNYCVYWTSIEYACGTANDGEIVMCTDVVCGAWQSPCGGMALTGDGE